MKLLYPTLTAFLLVLNLAMPTGSAWANNKCVSFEHEELPMSGRKIIWINHCGGSAKVTINCSNGKKGSAFVPSCGTATSYLSTSCGDGNAGFTYGWRIERGADLLCQGRK